jgi:hypothetical protein
MGRVSGDDRGGRRPATGRRREAERRRERRGILLDGAKGRRRLNHADCNDASRLGADFHRRDAIADLLRERRRRRIEREASRRREPPPRPERVMAGAEDLDTDRREASQPPIRIRPRRPQQQRRLGLIELPSEPPISSIVEAIRAGDDGERVASGNFGGEDVRQVKLVRHDARSYASECWSAGRDGQALRLTYKQSLIRMYALMTATQTRGTSPRRRHLTAARVLSIGCAGPSDRHRSRGPFASDPSPPSRSISRILRHAGSVRVRQVGRQRVYRLDARCAARVFDWANLYRDLFVDPSGHAWRISKRV